MKKYILAALIGVLSVGTIVPAHADTDDYPRPRNVQILWTEPHEIGVGWSPVRGARYYTFRASRQKDMSPVTVRECIEVEDLNTAGVLHHLQPDRRYYVQVAVSNWKCQKRSDWSVKVVTRTAAE